MEIQEASAHDIPQILTLWREFWPPQAYEQNLPRKIETDHDLVLVAKEDGRIVGTVIGGFDGWWAWVYRVAVSRTHQHRGIASELLTELHKRIAARGANAACLFIDPANANMCGLLEKLGYQPRHDQRYSFVFQSTPAS
ncbi:MAG: GNAT family N-acetyltransferase [Phycisphaeraceae bacterium]|nr:GNAT family N-acetyltransferase [Phycisphaeraceae bacterium]